MKALWIEISHATSKINLFFTSIGVGQCAAMTENELTQE